MPLQKRSVAFQIRRMRLGFDCRGGVAQLGERLVRNQKVVSSILITSTKPLQPHFRLIPYMACRRMHSGFCEPSSKSAGNSRQTEGRFS